MEDLVSQILTLVAAHSWAGLGGLLCMVFVTLLTDRAKFCPSWHSPLRPFLGTLFGTVGMMLNIPHDGDMSSKLLSAAATALPTLVAELLIVFKQAPPPESP